ncbi:MAG: nitroreductase family protein [Xanthobacteraceae bacterium]|jgi:nitroreductase
MTKSQADTGLEVGALEPTNPTAANQRIRVVGLPQPRTSGGMPLLDALKLRHSTREYSQRPISLPILSDLLWAAFGVNRPSDDRTAPYWRHVMVIDVYVASANGVWIYNAKAHTLLPHLSDDIRAQTGYQDFVGTAPLDLIYVAHGERMTDISPEEQRLYAAVDAGFIGQNVYLFCASEGLATVFRGAIEYTKLEHVLRLPEQQFVTFAQTVGYAR